MTAVRLLNVHRWLEAQGHRIRGARVQGALLLHLVGSVCVVLADDGQRVSLGVKHPVVERQVVVVGEEQVEIPGGDIGRAIHFKNTLVFYLFMFICF